LTRTCPCEPVTRRVWAPVGERPTAHGHHRFDWLYVTAFASPATGETFWYLSNGVSKPFFEALLETFAREAEAGVGRIILLVLDNAGWHGAAGLKIQMGCALFFCRPTVQNCSLQKHYGRCSTSRSSTRTLRPSPTLKRRSPTNASPSPSSRKNSKLESAFIGGQISPN
jgi:hypothetical protein